MGGLVFGEEVDRIDLGDGEWVEIVSRLTYGILDSLGAKHIAEMTRGKTSLPIVLFCIRKWNLKGQDGKVAPVTIQNLKQLEYQKAGILVGEVKKRFPFG